MAIEFLHNPDYAKGSALSLYAARDVLRGPTLIMDADVVFPREFLFRPLRSAEPNAFLIDEGFEDTGEEVKIYVQDEPGHRARKEGGARRPGTSWAKASAS